MIKTNKERTSRKMTKSNYLQNEYNWQSDDDFERKLLMHCEAHAHEDDSIVDTDSDDEDDVSNSSSAVDTTLDEDDDGDADVSNNSFTMIQIGSGDPPSDEEDNEITSDADAINIVSTIHEEETGIEVIMQRLCESCGMDVADAIDFDRQCPFCKAAQNFDLHFEDDSSSLCLDGSHRIEDDDTHYRNQPDSVSLTALRSKRRVREKQNDQLLKGIIATFLQENKNAQGRQLTTRVPPSKQEPFTKPKTSTVHDDVSSSLRELNVKKETIEKFMLYHYSDDFHRPREIDKFETSHGVSNRAAKSNSIGRKVHTEDFTQAVNHVDTLDIRCELTRLERYYSRQ